jgi:hypothetical protein
MIMRQHLFTIFLLLLMAGCATRPPVVPPVNIGSRLQINEQFDALPNGTRIDFQGGQRIRPGNLDKWTTYCRLYVYNRNQKADYVTAVLPGSFKVTRVEVKYNSSDSPPGFYYTGLNWGVREVPAYYVYQVLMQLTSPDQPDIKSLNCYKKWATPRANQYPTLTEIRQALGNLIEIIPLSTTDISSDGGLSSDSI